MHKRVLISNRGEIAIRIAKTANALGIESVGIYPAADEFSLHAHTTTRKQKIGNKADPVSAYLDAKGIVEVAVENGCDCLHPGYGFLSESAEFAELCDTNGITFVGPPGQVMSLFGDKVQARAFASSLGIPIVAGTEGFIGSAAEAEKVGAELGYPVMLKAAAGGGGRGMRVVDRPDQMREGFLRCSSEAQNAFGNASVFMEKLIDRPKHIEVQILGDQAGHVIHLYDRDCSVQRNHQKMVETAPALGVDISIRNRIFSDAVTLAKAAGYVNAGTVEFLAVPETGEYYFIECNPRIQVEHTITEQVTGIDLVETQFKIAAGATLENLGLGDQDSVAKPRGFAVQARVVGTNGGRIRAYKEPSGAGVRVDACGYVGYSAPSQFDPLLAKIICSASTYEGAVSRSIQALDEFLIDGPETNKGDLRAILSHQIFRNGDARTSFLSSEIEVLGEQTRSGATGALDFLHEQAGRSGASDSRTERTVTTPMAILEVLPGQIGIECPMDSVVVEVRAKEGDRVTVGDPILVVSAMKMETLVAAAISGVLTAMQPLEIGNTIAAGQVVAVVTPSGVAQDAASTVKEPWAAVFEEVNELRRLAKVRLAPDSTDPGVMRQRSRGKLTCRERIALLLDPDSFREVGSVAGFASYDRDGQISGFTPANSVGGWGQIEARQVILCADDFTSRGGHADGAIAAKSGYLDRLATEMRIPSIRLLDGSSGGGSVAAMVPEQTKETAKEAKESSGAITAGRPRVSGGGGSYLPGHLGSSMYAEQLSAIPVVNVLLGSVVGIGAAKAVLGHFSVMVRDVAQLFVAGPPVVQHAMGYEITKEDLGGWHIHCTNGSVDNLAETEEEAMNMVRKFLSYMPSSVYEPPPVLLPRPDDPHDRQELELGTIVPRKRTTTFDVRKVIKLIADHDSFFEIGSLWGTDQVTGFARFNGHPVGVIASDSRHVNGGALTADGCDKLTRHLDLCDSFHLPVLNLVDNPGFAVGLEHELRSTIRKGGNWMIAFAQTSVPIFTVLMRRSFGVAGNNYATPRSRASVRVSWPAADVGGIPPEGGIEAAYKRQLAEAEDPVAFRAQLEARIESVRGPMGPLNKFQMEEMIDPKETRQYVCEWVVNAYTIVGQPSRLIPRPLQFRP